MSSGLWAQAGGANACRVSGGGRAEHSVGAGKRTGACRGGSGGCFMESFEGAKGRAHSPVE
eukprot:364496-Chlamydomonas_euryale.AAC.59